MFRVSICWTTSTYITSGV